MQGALRACYSRLHVGEDNQEGYEIGAVSLVYKLCCQDRGIFFFTLYMYRIVYILPSIFSRQHLTYRRHTSK
jgi:hypothetical protein